MHSETSSENVEEPPSSLASELKQFRPAGRGFWANIPDALKDSGGLWFSDYGGYISIGCNATKVATCPATIKDLDNPAFKGKVALNGDPTQAGAAFSGVMMAALSQGGSPDDVAPGVEFFRKLNEAGNFLPVDPTPATIESGQTITGLAFTVGGLVDGVNEKIVVDGTAITLGGNSSGTT